LNIREHIEAGHYPKDDKGRAVVPMQGCEEAVILATDWREGGGDTRCIIGWRKDDDEHRELLTWDADGKYFGNPLHNNALLPPPPRKVPVKAWAIVQADTGRILRLRDNPPSGTTAGIEQLVELTGEREEPWS
jgi:hypothetical protein